MVDKISREEIELPKCLDVLIHLPTSKEMKEEDVYVAHALQYNISAIGFSCEEALERVVNLVVDHCGQAIEMGINPARSADQFYWAAFGMGEPIADAYVQVRARVSRGLIQIFGAPEREVEVRDVCAKQEESGMYDLKELTESTAR